MAISTHAGVWRTVLFRLRALELPSVFARNAQQHGRTGLQKLPPLGNHLARDIGLTEADLEWSRHKLPSQHTHHPRG